jgi:hypothetical protein
MRVLNPPWEKYSVMPDQFADSRLLFGRLLAYAEIDFHEKSLGLIKVSQTHIAAVQYTCVYDQIRP